MASSGGCSQRLLRVASNACSKQGQEDARLLRFIRALFNASHGIYGAPRVFLDLREAGETCSKHRVARLMRESGFAQALHGYRNQACIDRQAVGVDPEPASAAVHGHAPEQGVGNRCDLHSHLARLALSGCGDGLVFPEDHWLVDEPDDPSRTRSRCRSNGGLSPPPEEHVDSFGSGHAIRERCLEALLQVKPTRTEHEPQGNCWNSIYDSLERCLRPDPCWDWWNAFALTCRP